jgi:hypothetical protein
VKRVLFLPLIFLAGCVTPQAKVIRMPIPVPCVTETIKEPDFPRVEADAGLFERVQVLLAERELRRGYEGQLKAAIAACGDVK